MIKHRMNVIMVKVLSPCFPSINIWISVISENTIKVISVDLVKTLQFHPLSERYEENGLSRRSFEGIYIEGMIRMIISDENIPASSKFCDCAEDNKKSELPINDFAIKIMPHNNAKYNMIAKPNMMIGLYHLYPSNVLGNVVKSLL